MKQKYNVLTSPQDYNRIRTQLKKSKTTILEEMDQLCILYIEASNAKIEKIKKFSGVIAVEQDRISDIV